MFNGGSRRMDFNHYNNSWRPHGEYYNRSMFKDNRRWKQVPEMNNFSRSGNLPKSVLKRIEYNKKRRSRLEKRFAEIEMDMDCDSGPPISDSWNPDEETNQFDGLTETKTRFFRRPQDGYFPDKEEKKLHLKRWMKIDMDLCENSETSSEYGSSSQTQVNDVPETDSKRVNRRPHRGYSYVNDVQDMNNEQGKSTDIIPEVETIEDTEDDDIEIIEPPDNEDPGSSNSGKWWEQKRVYDNRITWRKNNFPPTSKKNKKYLSNDSPYSEDIDPSDSNLRVSNWNFSGDSFFPETKKKNRKKKKNNAQKKDSKEDAERDSSRNMKKQETRTGSNDVKLNEESKKIKKKRRRRKNKNSGKKTSSDKPHGSKKEAGSGNI